MAEVMLLLHTQNLGGQTLQATATVPFIQPGNLWSCHACSIRICVSGPFLSALSLLCLAESYRQIASVLQQEGKQTPSSTCWAKKLKICCYRGLSDCQTWGMLSRCWENVSLPQVGKALTSIMSELLCSPFLSHIYSCQSNLQVQSCHWTQARMGWLQSAVIICV